MNELVFGIIGHRKLLYVNRLENLIQDALKALAVEYTFTFIVSPLADGSDRIVAYAKKIKKPILHINTQTFKVYKINFENLDSVLNNPNNPK